MVTRPKRRRTEWLKVVIAALVFLGSTALIRFAAPDAEAIDSAEPELLVIERPYVEYVPIPSPVRVVIPVEVPVEVILEVPVDRPIIAQESAERWKDINITPEDIELLARLTWREARGEKSLGMRLVVEVVLNRVLSEHFPNTICDVLYQPGHFAPEGEALELEDITPTEAQYEAVMLAITETPILEPDVVFFATAPIYGETFLHVGGHYFTRYPD